MLSMRTVPRSAPSNRMGGLVARCRGNQPGVHRLSPAPSRAHLPLPARLSFPQAPARRAHRAAPQSPGTARAAGRADPAPAPASPPLPRGVGSELATVRAGHRTGAPANLVPPQPAPSPANASPARSPARYLWALLLARIDEILPLRCGLCGAQMRLIAFVTDPPALTNDPCASG